jgi:hypothetical protein
MFHSSGHITTCSIRQYKATRQIVRLPAALPHQHPPSCPATRVAIGLSSLWHILILGPLHSTAENLPGILPCSDSINNIWTTRIFREQPVHGVKWCGSLLGELKYPEGSEMRPTERRNSRQMSLICTQVSWQYFGLYLQSLNLLM